MDTLGPVAGQESSVEEPQVPLVTRAGSETGTRALAGSRSSLPSSATCNVKWFTESVHTKGDQSWVFIGRSDVEVETPIFWLPGAKS